MVGIFCYTTSSAACWPAFFDLTKYRCAKCRQISKSTSASAPFFDWLVEMAEERGGRILHPAVIYLSYLLSLLSLQKTVRWPQHMTKLYSRLYSTPPSPLEISLVWTKRRNSLMMVSMSFWLDVSLHIISQLFTFHSISNIFTHSIPGQKKHDNLIQIEYWVTLLCFPGHGTCQLSLSAFSTDLSPPARQWLWHRVAEASERVGDAGCLGSRGWGFASCTSTV